MTLTRPTGIHVDIKAALPGSGGGEGLDQHLYNIMTAPAAQHRCTSMPGQGASTKQRVEQLRLFPIDGVWEEPYTSSARAGNDAAMSAVAGEGRRV